MKTISETNDGFTLQSEYMNVRRFIYCTRFVYTIYSRLVYTPTSNCTHLVYTICSHIVYT